MRSALDLLLVEDNPDDARLVRELLGSTAASGFLVHHVDRLRGALTELSARPFAAVLLDLTLPDSAGLRTLERVREAAPGAPVVVSTGLQDESVALQAVRLGAQDYVIKGQLGGELLARTLRYAIERKSTEEALRASEERFRTLFENASIGLFQSNLDGRDVILNPAAARMLGYATPEEVQRGLATSELSLYAGPNDRNAIATRVASEGAVRNLDTVVRRRDGSLITVRVDVSARRDHTGRLIGFEGSFEDVTGARRHEALRQAQFELTRALSESQTEEEAYPRVVKALARPLGFGVGAIWVRQPGDILRCGALWHARDRNLEVVARETRALVLHAGEDLPGRILQTRGPLVACQLEQGQESGRPSIPAAGLKAGYWAPILGDSEILGVLELLAQDEHLADETFQSAMRDVGSQLGQFVARRRAEQRLAEAQQRLRHVVSTSPAVLFTLGVADGRFDASWVSENIESLFGYSAAEAMHPDWWIDHLHPDDRPAVVAAMGGILETGHLHQEYRFRLRSGDYRWIRGELRLLRDAAGQPSEIVGSWSDVTDRKEAELRIVAAAERYRLLFESNPQPMWVMDPASRRFIAVNDAAVRRYGWTREEFLALDVLDIRPAEEREVVRRRLEQLAGGASTTGWTTRHATKDGEILDVEVWSAPVPFYGRNARLVLAVDITERARAVRGLQRSEAKYRELFEEALTGNYVSSVDGTILDCNSAFLRIFGFGSVEEARATNMSRLDQATADHAALVALVASQRRVEYRPREALRVDGSTVHLVESVLGEFDGDGRLLRLKGFLFDDTPRRVLEEQLRQAQKMEAVGQLAGGVAHDFNNLLGVIIGYAEMVERRPDDAVSVSKRIGQIRAAADRAATLTGQLLAFSRKQVVRPQVLDLNAVVRDVERLLRRLIGEDIDLVVRLHGEPVRVNADPGQLSQVLMNLAVNARDAMPQGGSLRLETSIVSPPSAAGTDALARLVVTDTGHGMDAATQARIFEPFFTTKPEGRGTGLGLATVYGIVRQSGGSIDVSSAPGQGTRFTIHLPALPGDGGGAERPTDDQLRSLGGSETILLVEDSESLRDVARETLEEQGYRVLAADGPETALQVAECEADSIRLLLSDVIMPGMSGPVLAARLREKRPALKVVFMSGYTSDMVIPHGITEGGARLVQKPFTSQQLLQQVRDALDSGD